MIDCTPTFETVLYKLQTVEQASINTLISVHISGAFRRNTAWVSEV